MKTCSRKANAESERARELWHDAWTTYRGHGCLVPTKRATAFYVLAHLVYQIRETEPYTLSQRLGLKKLLRKRNKAVV